MEVLPETRSAQRYVVVPEQKSGGETYTPKVLADFVANQIVESFVASKCKSPLRVLDPGVGDGELLLSILAKLKERGVERIEVHGFETQSRALQEAARRILGSFPDARINFTEESFLQFVLDRFGIQDSRMLFEAETPEAYDIIIANPPYVRTQIMGAQQAQLLAENFGLSGRVDLYHAFILGIARVLKPNGIAGVIVSNRFMTTKAGSSIRGAILEQFNIQHVWDLGDTKLFQAAVLPAVLLVEGKNGRVREKPAFTSIYETSDPAKDFADNQIEALSKDGPVQIHDGRRFLVQKGTLENGGASEGVWRIGTKRGASWLKTVERHTWGLFGGIGKIRVGVKTCADDVYIRSDWEREEKNDEPELLRPVTTHHIARRFKPLEPEARRRILYPHESVQGRRRAIDVSRYPRSKAYLERHRSTLERRTYVIESGREWYEIWVPQDPGGWGAPKLIFRDIAQKPTFWIDLERSVVNGDCYWLACDKDVSVELLWLACAVGNSSFIEKFYDHSFHNKLYAGRRRFMTQYVEKFPLPDPRTAIALDIIHMAKSIHKHTPSEEADELYEELDRMIWESFGLSTEEIKG